MLIKVADARKIYSFLLLIAFFAFYFASKSKLLYTAEPCDV